MKKKTISLTASEYEVMELLWASDHPMTSVELTEHAEECGWKSGYIFILLRSLSKKGMIESCGTQQYGTQYARQFRPAVTKEEYAAKFAVSMQLDSHSVPKVAVALAKETAADSDEVIRELEEIIRQFQAEIAKTKE